MNKFLMRAAAFCALIIAPSTASAAVQGYSTANVNMRSGPSTAYPAVTVIPAGERVTIHGCMSSVNWCDVVFYGGRGWVSGNYVQAIHRSNRVYVEPNYYGSMGIPLITFDVDRYWGTYYRDRNFYRERDRWREYRWDRADRRPPPRWDDGRRPPPPGWDRDRRPPPGFDRDRDRDRDRWDRDRDRDRWDRDRDRGPDRDRGRDRDRDRDRERDRDRDRDRDRPRANDGDRPQRPGFDDRRTLSRDQDGPREERSRGDRGRDDRRGEPRRLCPDGVCR